LGTLKSSVSDIIAAASIPAIFLEGLLPFSNIMEATIVDVLPTGSFLKYIGFPVKTSAIL